MIDKLTKEQEEQFEVYVDKWLKIGLCTDKFTREEAEPIVNDLYKHILKKDKVPLIIMDSPLSAWLAACLLNNDMSQVMSQVGSQVMSQVRSEVMSQVESQVRSQVKSQVWSQVRSQVESQVWSQVEVQVWSQVDSQVGSQVMSQVRSQVWSQVESQVKSQVESQVESQVGSYIHPHLDGHLWAAYLSFYDYFSEIVKIKLCDNLNIIKRTLILGNIYPLYNVCIISQKPIEINMVDGLLHAEGKPSIKYVDGFSVWSLNGVKVPQYLAETPESELDIEFFKKEKNADVKAEFIRKYGIDRMSNMGKSIDSFKNYNDNTWWVKSEYELIDMSPIFESINYAPHLKMKNQTTGTYHMEGVIPECRDLPSAIKFRFGERELVIQDIK